MIGKGCCNYGAVNKNIEQMIRTKIGCKYSKIPVPQYRIQYMIICSCITLRIEKEQGIVPFNPSRKRINLSDPSRK